MGGAPALRAVIFDVDGTLADTERHGHRPAFNEAFRRHNLPIEWNADEYGQLLRVTGGRRRVEQHLNDRGYGDNAAILAEAIHRTKTELFTAWVAGGGVRPRAGVVELVHELIAEGLRIAVATTGRRAWVQALLAQLFPPEIVNVVVTGDEVERLKPDPEVYLLALRRLGLSAAEALAVEDSEVGLRAASAAGLPTVVVTNGYTANQHFASAAAVWREFDEPEPLRAAHLRAAHQAWWS